MFAYIMAPFVVQQRLQHEHEHANTNTREINNNCKLQVDCKKSVGERREETREDKSEKILLSRFGDVQDFALLALALHSYPYHTDLIPTLTAREEIVVVV